MEFLGREEWDVDVVQAAGAPAAVTLLAGLLSIRREELEPLCFANRTYEVSVCAPQGIRSIG
jgi:hypothetical protein